jgi:hypothetical protein
VFFLDRSHVIFPFKICVCFAKLAIAICGGHCWLLQSGNTALMCAAVRGNTECVRLLLDVGSDLRATDKVCGGPNLCCFDFGCGFGTRDFCDLKSLCQGETYPFLVQREKSRDSWRNVSQFHFDC